MLAVVALATVAVALPAPAASASPAESISRYDSRVEIHTDGSIRVTETIRYDFGTAHRHGIVRAVPDRFRYDDRRDRLTPVSDVSARMDGRAAPVQRGAEGGVALLRIGDPRRTVSGPHTYVVGYTVRGAFNHFSDYEELDWNAVGGQWTVPIAAASVTLTGPAPIGRSTCYAGPTGSRLPCEASTVDGATATFRHTGLGNGSGLTVVVGLPPGSVGHATPILADRHDLANALRVTPATVAGGAGLALLGCVAALVLLWLVGRDRRPREPWTPAGPGQPESRRSLLRRSRDSAAVQATPPDEVRPGQVGTLIDERANTIDVAATIVDLAVRGHLRIAELTGNHPPDWELTRLTEADPAFRPYERTLFDALFRGRDQVRLSQLRNTFATDLEAVKRALYADVVEQGWYRRSPARTRLLARVIAALLLAASVLITVVLGWFAHAALIGVGLVVGCLVLLAVAGQFPARTGRGSAILDRVRAFRRYLATVPPDALASGDRERTFSRYLPYAMVFGLADRWAGNFADLDTRRGGGPAGLYWYAGVPGWSMYHFHQSIGAFNTTTVGTIATTPPAASGSSGFSGGFSGGGFGGGGGGSW